MKSWKDYIWVWCGWVIINDQWEVLLLKRSMNAKNEIGYWTIPWWEVEYWEKVIDAIKRELKEEVWVDTENIQYLYYTDHIIENDLQHRVSIVHLMKIVSWEIRIMEPNKFDDMQWFDIDNLPDLISPAALNPIKVYKEMIK